MTDVKAMRCPACGGPIQFEEDETLANCKFCGIQVHRPDEKPVFQPPQSFPTSQPVVINLPVDMTTVKRNTGIGLIIAILIPLFIFGLVFAIISSVESEQNIVIQPGPVEEGQVITSNQIYSIADTYLVDAGQQQFLAVAYLRDNTRRYVYLDFNADSPERWRSEALPEDYYSAAMFVGDQALFFALKTELYALSREDGSELWRVKLSDELAAPCEACLRVIDTRVVVLLKDGQLAAFDQASGSKAWGAMLEETSRTLVVLDNKPAVWDKGEDGAVVRIFDLASGQEALRVAPDGPNEPFPNDPQTPDIYSPLLVDPDGKSFYTLFGTFEPLSIQRYDAQTGNLVWQALAPDNFSRTNLDTTLLTGGYLFVADGGTILAVETSSGMLRILEEVEDYELVPLAVQENRLLVSARRQRGTSRDELWAYDLQSGAISWKVVPTAQTRKTGPSGFVGSEGEWIIRLVNGGVLLLEFQNDPMGMTWQRIDLASGIGGAQKTMLPPDQDSTTLYLKNLIWQNENLWYAGDELYWIDLELGQSIKKWPQN